ncbi:Cof-type HAD-IIB family hydrolase [Laceyella putida]|uniref:Cof-type HAD-IIB family hydrolase n=1 Tax=Laceyella putida TaxID=110101 RepID=A0ABW2RH97_9BACL
MIRLFVSDLDNTLFNDEKTVSPENKEALRALVDEGVQVCLASGRMDKELVNVMNELNGTFHRISQNGAFIYNTSNQCLLSSHFDGDTARELFQMAEPYQLAGFISQEDSMFVPRKNEMVKQIEAQMRMPIEEHAEVLDCLGTSIHASKLCYIGDMDEIRKLERAVKERFPGKVDSFISDRHCIDFMPPGISKGAGLKKLIDHLGIKEEEVACIGDSYNDISMLRLTPHSFAMAVADDAVKQEATHVASSVAEAVRWVLAYNKQAVTK